VRDNDFRGVRAHRLAQAHALISPELLTVEYLVRLAEDSQFSNHAGFGTSNPNWPAHRIGPQRGFLADLRLKQPRSRILSAAFRGRDRAMQQFIERQVVRAEK
jgi:hypothetical protein